MSHRAGLLFWSSLLFPTLVSAQAGAPPAPPPPPVTEPAPSLSPAAPETAPLAPEPPAPEEVVPPPPPAEEEKADEEFPKKLSVGTEGLFQPGVLLQGWFRFVHTDDTATTFQMRRAELHAKGEIIPKLLSYAIMIDPARALEFQNKPLPLNPPPPDGEAGETVTASQPPTTFPLGATSGANSPVTIFQDFFITVQSEYMDVSLGQFKIPVSYEGYNSSSKLLFVERSVVSRRFGDRRDMGIRLAKTFKYFGYSAGIFNGTGQNTLDDNNAKDLALRLEAYPVEGLLIGAVAYGSVGKREAGTTKDRVEGDLRYERGPFIFQGEYIWGHDNNGTTDTDGQGFYTTLGWTFAEVLQPVVRFGYFDKNLDADDDSQLSFDAGLNWYILKQEAKLQLDFFHFANEGAPDENDVILCAQLWF